MSEQSGMDRIARRRQVVTVGDRQIELAALTVGDFVEIRQQAIASRRREMMKAHAVAAEYLSEEDRRRVMSEAVERVASIGTEDLPAKLVKIPRHSADGSIATKDGEPVIDERLVEYSMWWASETLEGQIFCCWLSMRACPGQEHMTLADVDVVFTDAIHELAGVADAVVQISEPRPNASGRREKRAEARRRRRGRR